MPECLRDIKTEVQPRFFIEVFISREHVGEVCIIFKSMLIKTETKNIPDPFF